MSMPEKVESFDRELLLLSFLLMKIKKIKEPMIVQAINVQAAVAKIMPELSGFSSGLFKV